MTIRLSRSVSADGALAARREWLLTNGVGGYAMGTVSGELTRAYHGYLVAALAPPLGRTLSMAKLEETLAVAGRSCGLSTNRWESGAVAPTGYAHLERFELDGGSARWTFVVGDVVLEKRLWMTRERNEVYVRYTVARASDPVALTLVPLVNDRSHHGRSRSADGAEATLAGRRFTVARGARSRLVVEADGGRATLDASWWRGFHLQREADRGLDPLEDHLALGRIEATLFEGQSLTVRARAGSDAEGTDTMDQAATRSGVQRHVAHLLEVAPATLLDDPRTRQLLLAADQFVVRRGADRGGATVIAGYPWFGDWGRDTMIALPGLALATGRFGIARDILSTWAAFVDRGMIPNRFPGAGQPPEYHTVDATLFYVEAVRAYVAATHDLDTARTLFPVLEEILARHHEGTRHGIGVDPSDGLLRAGEPGVQLTWMDARVGGRVITPRMGKPVEINALYYNALRTTCGLARQLGRDGETYRARAARVRESFGRYWNAERGFLYDVIDGPGGPDARLRPNQLFAASLHHSPLERERRAAVVRACARALWTPVGLRSLARGEEGYLSHFAGPPERRDAAYHQGTVWGWLLGPLASASYAADGDAERALSYIEPILGSLCEHGVGTLSEVFEPEPPFEPRGCIAQAWTVAEVLRVWHQLTLPSGEA